ncbi:MULTISPECIES: hypothetical protein [Pseudomonas putida group]|uniref:hypothetical protein n=1 Tax=Pseudomonas putida group TaxID=136845 RepID=UPI00159649BB|nr:MULTISPECIES: hypothetical protein [Pseudomonas putida group]MCZ9636748.1 hypothetical protein [Pseudomonas putida]
MSTPKRTLINQSIDAMFELLSDICQRPRHYEHNEQVIAALQSQGGLCNLDIDFSINDKQFSIRPLSLNTLKKRLSENGAERDLSYLDRLRSHAMAGLAKLQENPVKVQDKRSLSGLADKVEELEAEVASLQAANMVLIQALDVNRRDLISILDTTLEGLRQKRIKDAVNRIIRILSLNPTPFNDVSLLSTKSHLQLVPNEKKNS